LSVVLFKGQLEIPSLQRKEDPRKALLQNIPKESRIEDRRLVSSKDSRNYVHM